MQKEKKNLLTKYTIIIPAYNEEDYIAKTLDSVLKQTILPYQVIVVNDNSTDKTQKIVEKYIEKYSFIKIRNILSKNEHQPGSKIIQAFLKGYEIINSDFDIIVKLDGDLELPKNYFETILNKFNENENIAMVGGYAYIQKSGEWILENLTDKEHIRGAFKAYRKECYEKIGGLQPQMGWDTVDELLCRYYGWNVVTIANLHIKHLKQTGINYNKKALYKQGNAYYSIGFDFFLTLIAAIKLSFRKKKLSYVFYYLIGYFESSRNNAKKMVNKDQERFIRNYRWSKIKRKLKSLKL